MSARSSRPSPIAYAVLAAAAAAGCSKKQPAKPQADPAKVTALAATMYKHTPAPAAVRNCKPEELAGGAVMTYLTVLKLGNQPIKDDPVRSDWINPSEVEHPAARTLVDPAAEDRARREAAAELLAAPHYVVFRVEMIDVPLALEIKELKRGAVGVRAIRYDKRGRAACLHVFTVQNDKQKSEWAMDQTTKVTVDPEVVKALRDDLHAQMIARISDLTGVAQDEPAAE
jgi:hypothetical protein